MAAKKRARKRPADAPLPDATLAELEANPGNAPIPVDCPELGRNGLRLYMRLMEGPELDAWEAEQYALVDAAEERLKRNAGQPMDKYASMQNVRARLVHRLACNAEGERLFPDPDDLAKVQRLHPKALDRLYHVGRIAHGMVDGDLEEVAGKSAGGTDSGSASD